MNLVLTSDFPFTANRRVVERINAVAAEPRIAWIPPSTDRDAMHFTEAARVFGEAGFGHVEYLDVDEDLDQVQLAYLHEFDVIYLGDGDPIRFRNNAMRAGLAGRLRQCASRGRLIIGSGSGALLLTPSVALFRLQSESMDDVLATRGRFDAMGVVSYELLPHANRADPAYLDLVRRYSERSTTDVVALHDGSVIFPTTADTFEHVGTITRYRRGEIITTDSPLE